MEECYLDAEEMIPVWIEQLLFAHGVDDEDELTPAQIETEIAEEEVPLTAGAEEGSAMPIVVVFVVLLAACGGVIIFLQKRKAIVK